MNGLNKFLPAMFLSAVLLFSSALQGQAQCVCPANPTPGVHLDERTIAAMGTGSLIGNGDC